MSEIGNFGEATKEELLPQIKAEMAAARMEHNNGAVIATTIATQTGAIAALRTLRWKPAKRFANPNTGGTGVTMWFRNLNLSQKSFL